MAENDDVEKAVVGEDVVELEDEKWLVPVDEKCRSRVLRPWRFDRPHHRAFFFAWSSFFLAFFGWFALSPLLVDIGHASPEIGISEQETRVTSNIVGVAGTIFMRLVIGPVADRYGPRWAQSVLLIVFSIPVFLVGTSRNYTQFVVCRFFIGFLGAAFVVTQYWTSIMFAKTVVGAANATSAGWGNLGGGVTNALMPQFVKLCQVGGLDYDPAWRIAMVIPASLTSLWGFLLFFFSDDCPNGNYRFLIMSGRKEATNPWVAFGKAAVNVRVWILHATYAVCFGVELIMNANLAAYFTEAFGLDTGLAGLIAGLFGLMNLFARSLGGLTSDLGSTRYGMTGRLVVFFVTELCEGFALLAFSRVRVLGSAIPLLLLFSILVQMAEGATFGVVPYVDPTHTGAVSGIVGAGGNVGAVCLGLLFRENATEDALMYLSFVVLGVSFLILTLVYPFKIDENPENLSVHGVPRTVTIEDVPSKDEEANVQQSGVRVPEDHQVN